MSPQPSRIGKFSVEGSGLDDDLVFGTGPESSIVISKALMARLWTHVNEGKRVLARGGLEVGGLLVGPKVFGSTVVVDEIIPVRIEYRHGPLFQMSSSDLAAIQATIESVQEDKSRTVVGLYRGRPHGDMMLRQSDHEILDAIEQADPSFAADFRCFFVLSPTSEYTAYACVTMHDGSGWDEMQPYTLRSNPLSIIALPPFKAVQQMSRNSQTEEPAMHSPVPSAVQPPVVNRVPEHRVTEHRVTEHPAGPPHDADRLEANRVEADRLEANRAGVQRATIFWYVAAGLVAVAIAVGTAYRWTVMKQPQPAQSVHDQKGDAPQAHLGFSAAREGPVWKLSWDRAAMDALKPVGAVLTVEDGGYQQQVPLEPADLASGTLFYTPQSNELTFGLRIDRGGSHVEEHVRVLEAARANQKPLDNASRSVANFPVQGRAGAPGGTPPAAASASSKPGSTGSAAATPVAPTPVETPTKEPAVASRIDRTVKSFSPPASQPSVVAIAVPVPPPDLALPNPGALSPGLIAQAPVRLAPPAPPKAEPTPAAAVATGANAVPSTTPARAPIPPAAAPSPTPVNYVGPKPVQQVRPAAPAQIPPGVSQVEVLVDIDAGGKVTKVHPVGWTPANAPLMISATRAASLWVFAPAQLNGHAVASQMNLIFRF